MISQYGVLNRCAGERFSSWDVCQQLMHLVINTKWMISVVVMLFFPHRWWCKNNANRFSLRLVQRTWESRLTDCNAKTLWKITTVFEVAHFTRSLFSSIYILSISTKIQKEATVAKSAIWHSFFYFCFFVLLYLTEVLQKKSSTSWWLLIRWAYACRIYSMLISIFFGGLCGSLTYIKEIHLLYSLIGFNWSAERKKRCHRKWSEKSCCFRSAKLTFDWWCCVTGW